MEDEDSYPSGSSRDQLSRTATSHEELLSPAIEDRSIVRSCLTCHRRKIRCDKRFPCSACVRNDVLCCYPEVDQNQRRQPRTTIREISTRLGRLERTISALTESAVIPDWNQKAASEIATPPGERAVSDGPTTGSSPEELLVQDGSTSRYINEVILSRILDEERELKAVMSNSSFDSTRSGKTWSSDLGGIFHDFNQSMTDMQSYHPNKRQALQLWQTFLNNVDPIIKILHIPTTQAAIYTAINNPGSAESDLNALLFAIYFAATTSLSTADVSYLLGQDRGTILHKFKQGLEHSLACANIFDSPSMRSLQAMALYVTCLRAFTTGRSGWALTGLSIRLAQSIGFHRDGSNLGLSPFESEMRRRVWWHLFVADSRTAEDLGFTICNFDQSSDSRLPLNVNDSDLSPDMQELPAPKPMWTEMTFALIKIELGQVSQQIIQRPAVASGGTLSDLSKAQVLKGLRTRLEDKYLKHWDQNVPIYRVSSLLTPISLAKMEFIIQQQASQRSGAQKLTSDAKEDTLILVCQLLDNFFQLTTDELLRGFHWYLGSYTQYYLLTYLLWHLCVKPDGPNVEQAWNTLERSFQIAEHRQLTADSESKWTVLRLLRQKALLIKETYNAGLENNNEALEQGFGMPYSASDFGMATDISQFWNWDMPN